MDTESLLQQQPIDGKRRSSRVGWEFAGLAVLLLGCASVAAYWQQSHTTADVGGPLQVVVVAAAEQDSSAWTVGKKIHPPHPKKLHHGEVLYSTVQDPDLGRYYKREFLVPCGYGLLVFNIGPADESMPYDFDVFDDGYVYSDNAGLCFLYPSYRAHQNDTTPFWMPEDPTSFRVPLGHEMSKISTKINKHPNTKAMTKKMTARGGDYLIMAKRDFYDPHYYRALKGIVNSWKASTATVETSLDLLVEDALEDMFAEAKP